MTPTAETTPETQLTTPTGESSAISSAATASPTTRVRRENKQDKGTRLLTHGRLTVTKVDGDRVVAECRGDSGEVYELGYENGRWNCSCLARTDCSHLSALWRVTVRPK